MMDAGSNSRWDDRYDPKLRAEIGVLDERRSQLRRERGTEDPRYAESLADLAELHERAGDPATAEPLYREAVRILCSANEGDVLMAAQSCNRLALLHRKLGWDGEAARYFRKAWELASEKLPEDDPSCAVLLCNLAGAHRALGDAGGAESLYLKALEILRRILGDDHAECARTRGELAELYCEQGDVRGALALAKTALEEARRTLGPEHLDLVEHLNRLAGLHGEVGELAAAEPLLLEADSILRRHRGNDHPQIVENMLRLAHLYRAMGESRESERLYRMTIDLGRGRPDGGRVTVEALCGLAELHRLVGKTAAAEARLREALEIRISTLGADHPDSAVVINDLATLLHQRGELDEARELYQEAARVLEAAPRTHPARLAGCLNNLALVERQKGHPAAAAVRFEQVLELRRRAVGERHPELIPALLNLAGAYTEANRYGEAERHLTTAREICRTRCGADPSPLHGGGSGNGRRSAARTHAARPIRSFRPRGGRRRRGKAAR